MIGIINYGMGNLSSVKNALDYLHIPNIIIQEPEGLYQVEKLLLPGVGAFGMAMQNLNKSGFTNKIVELVNAKQVPILGICLGMQLLLESSTEHGFSKGIGLVPGHVSSFAAKLEDLPVPHVGWNSVDATHKAKLFEGIDQSSDFYFVHSYYCQISNVEAVAGTTHYGINFHSSLQHQNIYGCQFHPEKSQKNGLQIYSNFAAI